MPSGIHAIIQLCADSGKIHRLFDYRQVAAMQPVSESFPLIHLYTNDPLWRHIPNGINRLSKEETPFIGDLPYISKKTAGRPRRMTHEFVQSNHNSFEVIIRQAFSLSFRSVLLLVSTRCRGIRVENNFGGSTRSDNGVFRSREAIA